MTKWSPRRFRRFFSIGQVAAAPLMKMDQVLTLQNRVYVALEARRLAKLTGGTPPKPDEPLEFK